MALNDEVERQFACTDYGDHNIVLYSDLYAFREIYCRFSKQALEKSEIVLLATFYETVDTVRSALRDYDIDVRRHEEQGALVIVDSMRGYQFDATGVYRLARLLLERAERDGKAGVFNLSDMGSFFLLQKKQELASYERSLPKKFDAPLKGFCCYHKNDFVRLSDAQKRTLKGCHRRSIRV